MGREECRFDMDYVDGYLDSGYICSWFRYHILGSINLTLSLL
jgi:hypothetical protein